MSADAPVARGLVLALAVATLQACASHQPPPSPAVVEAARQAPTYNASLRVSLKGPGGRGRTVALLAFQRPDRMRIEIPGPGGLRLAAVIREGRLVATFPSSRAVHEAKASAASLRDILGVELEVGELMDLMVGVGSARISELDVRWGKAAPSEVSARLADGTRLRARIESVTLGEAIPARAFELPETSGLRIVGAEEARNLLVGR